MAITISTLKESKELIILINSLEESKELMI